MGYVGDFKIKSIKIQELSTGTVHQLARVSAQQAEVMGSNPRECHNFNMLNHVLSSVLP